MSSRAASHVNGAVVPVDEGDACGPGKQHVGGSDADAQDKEKYKT